MQLLERPFIAGFAISMCLTFAVQAQRIATVRGTVVDRSDAPVPNAVVRVESLDGVLQVQGRTDRKGEFSLTGVHPGKFTFVVPAANGFASEALQLEMSALTAPIRVVLAPETVTQTIDVEGGTTVSTAASSNQDSVAVAASTLDHLPVFDQDIAGALSPFLDPAATSSTGVSIVVDGIELKGGANVTPSAIAEVRINSDPYSAEFASPGRGRLEITTKPGSPQFHGTLNVIARDAVFNGRNYFAPVKPAEQRRIFEGHLTGPVGNGGHTTFLLTGTHQAEDLQSAVHASGPQGLIEQNAVTPNSASQITGRTTHDFSDAHRLAVSYNFRYSSQTARNVGGVVLPEAAIDETNRQDQIVLNDRVIVSPTMVQQLQVLLERETDSQFSKTDAQAIMVQDAFTGGGAQTNVYRTEHTIGLIEVVAWTHHAHYVRIGVNVPQISRRAVDDLSNRQGTYSFLSLSDYANHTPYQYTVQEGRGRATYFATEIATFVQDEISLLKNLQATIGVRYQFQTYLNNYGNFAPRFSAAYSPSKAWVIRAGTGIFFDRTGGDFPVTYKLHNGVNLRQYQLLNPLFPRPLPAGQTFHEFPTNLAQLAPNSSAGYQMQYSATIERQLANGLTATATYRGISGVKTFRSRDVNAPLPPYSVRPNPAFGFIQQVEAAGRSRLNALDLGLRGSIRRSKTLWFEGQVQYTFSHFDNNTGGLNWYPQDQYNPDAEYGRGDLDRRDRLNLLGTFHPDHWLTLGIATALYSGLPYTELAGQDRFPTGLGNARPVGIARNTLQGGGTASVDLLWDHDFHLNHAKAENAKLLNIGVSAFNVLNHANFTNYIGSVRSPLFGSATRALPGRQMQFGIRYQF
ncbi:TonB-dependent receptor domain-containing protein [Terriglobus sp.]|uniref:TonB-dependent receptor n=1 Tax=Terriglobus sp. TaxID=1889013 RepID=UPI003B006E32